LLDFFLRWAGIYRVNLPNLLWNQLNIILIKKRLFSKSQFNKNIRQQLESLDNVMNNNAASFITLPSIQSQSIGVSHGSCIIENNVSDITSVLSQPENPENNKTSNKVFVSSVPKFKSPEIIMDSDSLIDNSKMPISDQLQEWAIRNKITHVALGELLLILKQMPDLKNLPKDPRTFLQTPRKTILRNIKPGKYYHFGLENSLVNILEKIEVCNIPNIINVAINIDGLPLSDSSSSQVYPLLCLVTNIDILLPSNIFCVGIYHGYDKPSDFNDFLEEFVNEAVKLTLNGINIRNKYFSFKISMLLFDAVAKASILKIKGHSGYSSCTKCTQEGSISIMLFFLIYILQRELMMISLINLIQIITLAIQFCKEFQI